MSIEHVSIADADRHEVKHASTATANQILVANGDGTTKFVDLNYSLLLNAPVVRAYNKAMYAPSSMTIQQPSAINTPLKINFGPAQSTSDFSLAADGTLTFTTNNDYLAVVDLHYGRAALTGVSKLITRTVIKGNQVDSSYLNVLADATSVSQRVIVRPLSVVGLTTVYFEFYRDGSGVNEGGLYGVTPAVAGWAVVPPASLTIYKFQGSQ